MSGKGRLVMLVGEPGIGKTRTAEELTAHAQDVTEEQAMARAVPLPED